MGDLYDGEDGVASLYEVTCKRINDTIKNLKVKCDDDYIKVDEETKKMLIDKLLKEGKYDK